MAEIDVLNEATGETRTVPLGARRLAIGKGPQNDLVLDRDGISREHCLIFYRDQAYYLRDIKSRNGTYLDDLRIVEDAPLRDGARVRVGEFLLTFRDAARARADIPAAPAADPPREGLGPLADAKGREGADRDLKRRVHQLLLENRELKKLDFAALSEDEVREATQRVLRDILHGLRRNIPAEVDQAALHKEVLDEALGLGPLEDLLADPGVTEIMVNRHDRIFVERGGKTELADRAFFDDDQLLATIQRIVARAGRRVNESSPLVDARLHDGSRVNAVIAPVSVTGPSLTIRKFPERAMQIADLLRLGSLNKAMARFLKLCVEQRLNLCVAGGTGSGKTTLLNVLASFIPAHERIVTIEDVAELRLNHANLVGMEAKPPNLEGEGAIPIRQLVINALRMRPDRIVVGECRGGEALDMLQAMSTGHDGSLTTVHANSPREVLARLETLVLMSGMELPLRAIRDQIGSALDLIVHQARLADGLRRILSISEVLGLEGEDVALQEIFRFVQTGHDAQGRVQGAHAATGVVPHCAQAWRQQGIAVDMGIFKVEG